MLKKANQTSSHLRKMQDSIHNFRKRKASNTRSSHTKIYPHRCCSKKEKLPSFAIAVVGEGFEAKKLVLNKSLMMAPENDFQGFELETFGEVQEISEDLSPFGCRTFSLDIFSLVRRRDECLLFWALCFLNAFAILRAFSLKKEAFYLPVWDWTASASAEVFSFCSEKMHWIWFQTSLKLLKAFNLEISMVYSYKIVLVLTPTIEGNFSFGGIQKWRGSIFGIFWPPSPRMVLFI